MRPILANQLRGTWSTLLLPIDKDDSINFEQMRNQIDRLVESRVDGVYANGTACEFDSQTEEEFDRITRLLSDVCHASDMSFKIGVSHTSALISRQRLRRCVSLRPAAFQLILPDWTPPANSEIITFLATMADEADGIGLVLYNPPFAKRVLTPTDFAKIKAAVPGLIGIKVLGGDADWFADMNRLVPDVSIFVAGHLLAEKRPMGARGSYSNVACLNPAAAVRWEHLMDSDAAAAAEIGCRIQRFLKQHISPYLTSGFSNQAVDKLLASIGGWTNVTPRLRWPYQSVPASEVDRIRPMAEDCLPEFFQD